VLFADPDDIDAVDPALIGAAAPWVDRLCRLWFRLEVQGLSELPEGPALVAANHNSGTMFLEALGFAAQAHRATGELWCGLAHDALMEAPGLGALLGRLGGVRARHDAAHRAFAKGRKVLVFPGGNAEAFRTFRRRHEVDLQGRRGFLRLAVRAQVPICPVVFIGGHEGFIVLREGRRLAKLLRADRWLRSETWPVMLALPWGLAVGPLPHLPLPVRCTVRVLPPIHTAGRLDPAQADDEEAMTALYEEVQGAMQRALDELAAQRVGLRARL
jgi:1-acyl-sn-glycerol-3-phosphate acyltransferase